MKEETREKYETGFHAIIMSAELVAEVIGRKPRHEDLITAVATRFIQFRRSTAGAVLSALRYSLKNLIEHKLTGSELTIQDLPSWVTEISLSDLEKVSGFIHKKPSELTQEAEKIAHNFFLAAAQNGYQGAKDELLSDFRFKLEAGSSRKAERPVDRREIMMIDMALSDEPINNSGLIDDPTQRLTTRAITRILALSVWATGMRPVEMWDCRMMIPNPDKIDTIEKRDLALTDPKRAIAQMLYMLVESVKRAPHETIGDVIMKFTTATGAPAILVIKSAKQANANAQIRKEYRIQVLKDAPLEVLSMLGLVSQFRHQDINPKRKDRIRERVNGCLQSIVRNDPSFDRETLSLYTLRHSFATRVKMRLDLASSASLMGHTSKRMTYGYGQARRTKAASRSGSGGEWTPLPDAAHVDLLAQAWGLAPELDLEQDATPET